MANRSVVYDEAEIIECYEEYETARVVAELLGVSDQTVYRVLIRNGIPRTHRHDKPKHQWPGNCRKKCCHALVIMLRTLCNMRHKDIVRATGYSPSAVGNIIRRKGLTDKRKLRNIDVDAIERDYLAGVSTYELADKYGICHQTISKWMKKLCHARGKGHNARIDSLRAERRAKAIERFESEFCHDGRIDDSIVDSKARRAYKIAKRKHDPGITWRSLSTRNRSLLCEICGIECDPADKAWGSYGPTHPTVDHIVRICDGGTDTWDNVRLVCGRCNLDANAAMTRNQKVVA